jgi:hypothetical protein
VKIIEASSMVSDLIATIDSGICSDSQPIGLLKWDSAFRRVIGDAPLA